MQKRTSFSAQLSRSLAALLLLVAGCASPPPPAASTQSPPSVATAPATVAPPGPSLWTTPDGSKECKAYQGNAPEGAKTWPNREECEEWVKARACSPGASCFEGCNWVSCSADGSGWSSTALACEAFFSFEFTRGTSEPVSAELTAGRRTELARRLTRAERRLHIIGFAEAAEAATPALRQKLGRSRAERMRKLLVGEGFDPARIELESSEASQPPAVHISFVPRQPLREDFPVGTPEHDKFCGSR